jgi:DNA-binding MarR family transcriptional regulator
VSYRRDRGRRIALSSAARRHSHYFAEPSERSAIVNQVNDMTDTKPTQTAKTLAVADGLRPVLMRINRELRRETRAGGASPEQVSLLVAIKYTPGIGVRDLAARERVSAAAMSKHVDRLERDGLVERTPSEDDRRRVGLTVTDEGQRVLRRVRSRRTAWLVSRLDSLTAEELATIEAALGPLSLLLREEDRP